MDLRLVWLLTALTIFVVLPASGQTLSQLQQADKLRINAWIEPQQNILARQQIDLQIEIATDSRFSAGTRIGVVEVDDAIVLQRENFALNSVRNVGEKNWTLQQWTLVVYPQRGGVFNIPPISLQLSIVGDNNQTVVGDIATQAFSFVAKVPELMNNKDQWFASSRFDIEDSFNKPLDQLKRGDAFIRTLTMSAENLPAMMLPSIANETIEGIGIYPGPVKLNDKVVRGDYRAERSQQITYIIEKPGIYQLPEQTFYWWNLESDTVEVISLQGRTINAGSVQALTNEDLPASTEPPSRLRLITGLQYLGAILFLLAMLWFVRRRLGSSATRLKATTAPLASEAKLRQHFKTACQNDESALALSLLYQWLDNHGPKTFTGTIRESLNKTDQADTALLFEQLLASIYDRNKPHNIDIRSFAKKYINELNKLDRTVKTSRLRIDLKLN